MNFEERLKELMNEFSKTTDEVIDMLCKKRKNNLILPPKSLQQIALQLNVTNSSSSIESSHLSTMMFNNNSQCQTPTSYLHPLILDESLRNNIDEIPLSINNTEKIRKDSLTWNASNYSICIQPSLEKLNTTTEFRMS